MLEVETYSRGHMAIHIHTYSDTEARHKTNMNLVKPIRPTVFFTNTNKTKTYKTNKIMQINYAQIVNVYFNKLLMISPIDTKQGR